MNTAPQLTLLKTAISHFESDLEREVDPGERSQLQRWVRRLRQSFDTVHEMIEARRADMHKRMFRAIERSDPSQADAVRELKQADQEILERLEIVKSSLIALELETESDVVARIAAPRGSQEQIMNLTCQGAELIHWIRQQEETVTHWFAEAFANC